MTQNQNESILESFLYGASLSWKDVSSNKRVSFSKTYLFH